MELSDFKKWRSTNVLFSHPNVTSSLAFYVGKKTIADFCAHNLKTIAQSGFILFDIYSTGIPHYWWY